MNERVTQRQSTSDIFLVRPASFGPNIQTAGSNAFQKPTGSVDSSEIQFAALAEFDAVVDGLLSAGVNVIVFPDTHEPEKPDAIFPNNWISTDANGAVFLYPMQAENRRFERRDDIVERLSTEHGYFIGVISDFSYLELQGKYLEGTGSLVLDRIHRVAYAALSSRTEPGALSQFAQMANFEIEAFSTADSDGRPIYHTNVIMALGTDFAIVCAEAIIDAHERRVVLERIANTGRRIVQISAAQSEKFAGNMIELRSHSGDVIVAMSRAARESLSSEQVALLERYGRILAFPIDTIEAVGGGSLRCMIAEIFLPPGAMDN